MNLRRLFHRIVGHDWTEVRSGKVGGSFVTRYSCSCGNYGLQRGDFGVITDMGR